MLPEAEWKVVNSDTFKYMYEDRDVIDGLESVSYTHLTLPTNREV